ncbi:hypothetical protein RB653_000410 [Dictyostelium firmibasis]|uniref:FCP1 homology domain-containing protein n=1 Tax=Dictyostelium firmibasis TaxID=79012 RepID=A0AAN7U5X8_9MYCE
MEECSQVSTMPDQESIDKVVTQISPHQKTMDPSSVGFVYHWMFSMMASALNFNKPTPLPTDNIILDNNEKDSSDGEKQESFIRSSLGNIRLSASSEELESDPFYTNNHHDSSDDDSDQQNQDKENEEIVNKNNKNSNNISSNKCTKKDEQQNNNIKTTHHINQNNFLTLPASTTKKTLILDLDETLVHSTLKPVSHHHITVKVLIEDMDCTFYVIKRPHVDYFLEKVSQWYDIVIFTASMQQYADPLLDQLDIHKVFKKRLFRDSCLEKDGNFVKDLSMIDQDLTSTIIIDNSPIAYSNNLENALPIDNWMGDNPSDTSLLSLLPFLEIIRHVQDVRSILSLRLLNSQ